VVAALVAVAGCTPAVAVEDSKLVAEVEDCRIVVDSDIRESLVAVAVG
jgi:hypothetical protein